MNCTCIASSWLLYFTKFIWLMALGSLYADTQLNVLPSRILAIAECNQQCLSRTSWMIVVETMRGCRNCGVSAALSKEASREQRVNIDDSWSCDAASKATPLFLYHPPFL